MKGHSNKGSDFPIIPARVLKVPSRTGAVEATNVIKD
jgi:hypothetical protein